MNSLSPCAPNPPYADNAHDAFGRLASVTYPSGKTVSLAYADGRLAELDAGPSPLLLDIAYRPFGPPSGWTFGNGVAYARGFDLDGRATRYDLGGRARQLAYAAAGRVAAYADTDPARSQSFSYDAADRLLGYAGPASSETYQYDANGNRTGQAAGALAKTYAYEAGSNRLLGVGGPSPKSYAYDAAGNLVDDAASHFTYDGRGRLAQASNPGGIWLYRVDGLGQRVAKLQGSPPDLAGDANQDGVLAAADLRLIALMAQGAAAASLAADCDHDGRVALADVACAQAKMTDMRLHPQNYVQTGTYFAYDEAGRLQGE